MRKLTSLAFLLLIVPASEAQTVYGWNFSAGTGVASSGFNANLTVGPISSTFAQVIAATDPISVGYVTASGGNNFGITATAGAANTPLNVLTASYLSIKITPTAGFAVQVNSLNFGMHSILNNPSSRGAQNYELRSDANGNNFATSFAAGTNTQSQNTWYFKSNTPFPALIGAVNSPVELRLYAFNSDGSGTPNTMFDDVSLSLTPVPEPTTILGLTALGAGLVGGIRRRFRKSA